MKVSEAMTRDVRVANPNESLRDAARIMAEIDAGALPVGENDRLVGVITDGDIAMRAVAEGKDATTKVRDIMSREVLYCYDDQEIDHVARNMGDVKVRRLPVVNRDKRLVGIISLGDVACKEDGDGARFSSAPRTSCDANSIGRRDRRSTPRGRCDAAPPESSGSGRRARHAAPSVRGSRGCHRARTSAWRRSDRFRNRRTVARRPRCACR